MDILVDVRVEGIVPVFRIGQPAEDISLSLGDAAFFQNAVDGGLGGGEGNALDDNDRLHAENPFQAVGRSGGRERLPLPLVHVYYSILSGVCQ